MALAANDMIPVLLLVVLAFALALTVGLVLFVLHRVRNGDADPATPLEVQRTGRKPVPSAIFRPVMLKRADCWLAIKNTNLQAVQKALSLHDPKPCSWSDGWLGNGGQKLFISPPVSGWVLVIGEALPTPADDVDVCFRFLLDLSRKLGQIQFFSADTMFNHHAWVKTDGGRVVRAYAWAGRTLWNQGVKTQGEIDLKMKCREYADMTEPPAFNPSHGGFNNAEKVHLLASRWSLDPEEIDERFIDQEWGIVGEPSRRF